MTNFNLEEFDYKLPKELIAQYPRESRDQSNLLVYTKEGTILHQKFYEIANFIPKGSLLLRNVSKVIPARFLLQKQTGGKVEILLLEPISPSPDPQVALASTGSTTWKALLRGRNIKAGTILVNDCSFDFELTAKVLDKNNEYSILEFNSKNFGSTFSEILEKLGRIPLPPYISRNDEEIDKIRYQTIYGYKPGSVASPTAGLHFSEPIIANFNTRSI
ncbi:MAG: S-adenosylmethionine:tRNA ribosyltransferase-isomerase, partial [Candidatus Kapaibacteriota bacterium]